LREIYTHIYPTAFARIHCCCVNDPRHDHFMDTDPLWRRSCGTAQSFPSCILASIHDPRIPSGFRGHKASSAIHKVAVHDQSDVLPRPFPLPFYTAPPFRICSPMLCVRLLRIPSVDPHSQHPIPSSDRLPVLLSSHTVPELHTPRELGQYLPRGRRSLGTKKTKPDNRAVR